MRLSFLMWAFALGFAASVQAQPLQPAKPEQYTVHLRYRIRSDRDARIVSFRAMQARLKDLGFVETPREDADLDIFDPTAENLTGTMPAKNAAKVLSDPAIQTLIVIPNDQPLPDDDATPVRIEMKLHTGFGADVQRNLHTQTSQHLTLLGFRENLAYDHEGYSRLRGTLPAGQVLSLRKDLRTLPSGWFVPGIPLDQLPQPFRNVLPLRIIEVLPKLDMPAIAEQPPAAAAPAAGAQPVRELDKLAPDAKALYDNAELASKPARVDLILENDAGDIADVNEVKNRIRLIVPGIAIEGVLGPIVTVRIERTTDLLKIVQFPGIRNIRMPRAATFTAPGAAEFNIVPESSVTLSQLGYRGQGAKVVIIGSEFSGYKGMVGTSLPKNTQFIDLTAELDPQLFPQPMPEGLGASTRTAIQISSSAPDAQYILVRTDATALHQLLTVLRGTLGEPNYSEALQSRAYELNRIYEAINAKRIVVTEEYRNAFADLSDEEKQVKRREAAKKAFDELVAEEQKLRGQIDRFNQLRTGLQSLFRATHIVNTLTWNTGYPQDGLSVVSRAIESKLTPPAQRNGLRSLNTAPLPTWIQASAEQVGQVWAGPFMDVDGNGALEFARTETPLPKERWTHELNFLKNSGKEGSSILAAGAKLRFTVQWREPQDPDGYVLADPTFPMQLILLRQLDPSGKKTSSDDLVEVGRSFGTPVKLLRTSGSAAYEQTLEITLPTDGVYALRVEGRSAFVYQLPAQRQGMEITPRVVVESLDPMKPSPHFSIVPTSVGVGIPADCSAVLTVGSANSQTGFGPGVTLSTKPEVRGSLGSVAGSATLLHGVGLRSNDLMRAFNLTPGADFRVPPEFLGGLSPRRTER